MFLHETQANFIRDFAKLKECRPFKSEQLAAKKPDVLFLSPGYNIKAEVTKYSNCHSPALAKQSWIH